MRTVSIEFSCDRCGTLSSGRRLKADDRCDIPPLGWVTLFGYELCQQCAPVWTPIGLRQKQSQRDLDRTSRQELKAFLTCKKTSV